MEFMIFFQFLSQSEGNSGKRAHFNSLPFCFFPVYFYPPFFCSLQFKTSLLVHAPKISFCAFIIFYICIFFVCVHECVCVRVWVCVYVCTNESLLLIFLKAYLLINVYQQKKINGIKILK